MAEITPGEANVQRDGPQITMREARAIADEAGTVRGGAGQGHADREITEAPVRPNVATSNSPPEPGASGGAGNDSPDRAPANTRPYANSEAALGGADSVQKTSYGVGHGGEPDGEEHAPVGRKKGEGDVVSRVTPGGGVSPVAWVIGLLGLLALGVYAFGAFRG